jgi:hypothetical protein
MHRQHRDRDEPERTESAASPAAAPRAGEALLLNLQRQAGNRAVTRMLARDAKAPAQGPVTSGVSAPMGLDEFRREMQRFGVATVVVTDWNPGDPAAIYRSIVDAFADFASALGGTPPVREVCFRTQDASEPNAPAYFSAGRLTVFKIIETRSKWLPSDRSVKGRSYPPSGAQLTGVKGQAGGAPLPLPARAAGERRVIVHELGHAIVEGMMTPGVKQADPLDKDLIARFKKAAGWFGNKLYDIQDPAVRKAIQDDNVAPTAPAIEIENWNDPRWGEQPITDYPLTGAHEDFPESLMAYLYAPQLLKARSPARFKFFEDNKASWRPILAPQASALAPRDGFSMPGDYTAPDRGIAYA